MRSVFFRIGVVLSLASIFLVQKSVDSTAATDLAIDSFYKIVLDDTHGHAFLSSGPGESTIEVVNFDGSVEGTITASGGPSGMALSPDDSKLYVAMYDSDEIAEISTTSLAETRRFAIGSGAHRPASLASNGSKVWFSFHRIDLMSGGIGVIDPTAQSPSATLFSGSPMYPPDFPIVAMPTAAAKLFACDRGVEMCWIYDLSSGSPVKIASEFHPGACSDVQSIAARSDGSRLYLACLVPYSIDVMDGSDLSFIRQLEMAPHPMAVAVSPDDLRIGAGGGGQFSPYDIWQFSPDGSLISGWLDPNEHGAAAADGLAYSSDGKLFAVLNYNCCPYTGYRLRVFAGRPLLTIQASSSEVSYPSSVTVTAHLGPTNSSRFVTLRAQPYQQTPTIIRSGNVDLAGNISVTYAPKSRTIFTVTFAGDDQYDTTSAVVRVRPLLTGVLAGYYGSSGGFRLYHQSQEARFTGRMTPADPSSCQRYSLERLISGAWTSVKRSSCYQTASDGTARMILGALSIGKYRVRADFLGSWNLSKASSSWSYLQVTT